MFCVRPRAQSNRPFPSFPGPLYQNEVKCLACDMEMIFHSHANSFSQERLCAWPHFESEGFWTSEVAYRRKKKEKRIEHGQASEGACADSFQVPIFLTF